MNSNKSESNSVVKIALGIILGGLPLYLVIAFWIAPWAEEVNYKRKLKKEADAKMLEYKLFLRKDIGNLSGEHSNDK